LGPRPASIRSQGWSQFDHGAAGRARKSRVECAKPKVLWQQALVIEPEVSRYGFVGHRAGGYKWNTTCGAEVCRVPSGLPGTYEEGKMAPIINSVELRNGVRLPYVEQGDPLGVPLLLVHAVGDSWRSFEPMLPHLPGSIHVFVPTLRGHGEASRLEMGYRSRDFAEDLAAFMEALHIGAAVIAGGSSGGLVVLRFAIDYRSAP